MNRGNERDWLEESFVIYDTLGDHKIDIILLGDVLRGLGLNPTEGEVQKIIKELESSGSNRYLVHLNSFYFFFGFYCLFVLLVDLTRATVSHLTLQQGQW